MANEAGDALRRVIKERGQSGRENNLSRVKGVLPKSR